MSVAVEVADPPEEAKLSVKPLRSEDVDTADRVMRLAFGTFLGAPDPVSVFGDAEYVRPRYAARPEWAFGAYLGDRLVGSNFVTRWGSFGFFGPLTVDPEYWGQGIGSRLMEPIVQLFDQWGLRHSALFTFPQSPKHIGLYQKFGFWPQHLTPLLEKAIDDRADSAPQTLYSGLSAGEKKRAIAETRALTEGISAGLDLTHEIEATNTQGLGDTVLLASSDGLEGFAVCHCGAGEAGSGTCYVKFGAVRGGDGATERFGRLLDSCEALGSRRGAERMVLGVNAARHTAYRTVLGKGYRTWLEGILMQRPNESGHFTSDALVIDDLR